MKKLFALVAVTGLLAACSTAEYGGSDYREDRYYGTGYGTGTTVPAPETEATARDQGPGMHRDTATGVTGPGTAGGRDHFDSGLRP